MRCQVCKEETAAWAWQPFGPGETANEYALLGSHTRGFPIIKVGDMCKLAFQTGDFPVEFEYKGHHYTGKDREVKEVHVSLWLGESHRASDLQASVPVRALMRDTPQKGIDIAVLVFEDHSDLIPALLAAPRLLEACQELDKLRDKITYYLDSSYVQKADRTAILMALAKVAVAMKVNE